MFELKVEDMLIASDTSERKAACVNKERKIIVTQERFN